MNTSQQIEWNGWLLVTVKGVAQWPLHPHRWSTSAKLYVQKPSVEPNEVAVKVRFQIPSALFIRPLLEATITIPAGAVPPNVVNLEVQDNVADLLSRTTGFDVKILPVNPSSE